METKKILVNKDKVFYWKKGDLHTNFGVVKEEDLKKAKNGSLIKSHSGGNFFIILPRFFDNIRKIKRGPQAILEKDLGNIISYLGISFDWVILDAGLGSGKSSIYFSKYCKKVISYEIREDFIEIAKKNFTDLNIKNVLVRKKNIYEGISEKNLDLIFLDLPEPWMVVKHAVKSLKPGGFLVSYSPNLNQVKKFILAVEEFNFALLKTVEVIEREWTIDDRRMKPCETSPHTGFITFFRFLGLSSLPN